MRSLDDVMRLMWQQFGNRQFAKWRFFEQKLGTDAKPGHLTSNGQLNAPKLPAEIGFTPEELQSAIESVAGIDLSDFFAADIDGTEELPYNKYLEPFGLELIAGEIDQTPRIGWTLGAENGREMVKFVEANLRQDLPELMLGTSCWRSRVFG